MSEPGWAKKRHKKLIKAGKSVESDFGVKLSSSPTKFVLLSNGGLVNGGSTLSILHGLPEFETLQYDIVLIPNKTYAIVRCPNSAAASSVVEYLDGSAALDFLDGQQVHAGFLEADVPNPVVDSGVWPPGLEVLNDVLSSEEEESWLSLCSFDDGSSCSLKNRQVEHFGYRFDYSINGVHRNDPMLAKPIPAICSKFLEELVARDLLSASEFPNQLTVNRYDVGAGIPAHCDTHSMFSSCIVVVSLGSDVVMEYRNDVHEVSVFIPRRSVTLMQAESRYGWTHSIVPRKYDLIPSETGAPLVVARGTRTSFTFRHVRPERPCDCEYPSLCDSRKNFVLNESDASELEKLHVHEVYDIIASHFSNTRHTPWPRVVDFLQNLPPWSLVVDVGCGNGKYMQVRSRSDLAIVGCDRSAGLLGICRERCFQVSQADCLALPYRGEAFDAVICIAVIHHLSTTSRRKQAIQQMLSLLRVDGKLLISAWALDQNVGGESRYLKAGRSITVQRGCIRTGSSQITLPVHTNRSAFLSSDVLVPWKKTETQETQQRYYHVFKQGELGALVRNMQEVELLDEYYDEGNWCMILKKKHGSINDFNT